MASTRSTSKTDAALDTFAADADGLRVPRVFSDEHVHPYDQLTWEHRDAVTRDFKTGEVTFEQRGVEFPATWSLNATSIVATKYFRGQLGSPEREHSVRQMIDRVADTITEQGVERGYFASAYDAQVFNDELKWLLVNQHGAFNSPVWFNVGVAGRKQQVSACFILSVDDSMDSILNWYVDEGKIFQGGSGSGANLSRLRGSNEGLSGGGTASGPVSFMRGADASAGTIQSGGTTRRAAKMVILDADHPDIEEFVATKAKQEDVALALKAAGYDPSFTGDDAPNVLFQNANNSVGASDAFMQAVVDDLDWELVNRGDGKVARTIRARDLFRQISQAAWRCADPGMFYLDTINGMHTTPSMGPIRSSNPCFPASARVHTDKGQVPFGDLIDRVRDGEQFRVYTHDATNVDAPEEQVLLTSPSQFLITGINPIVQLRFSNGQTLRCTPNHKIFTANRGYVPAAELTADDRVRTCDLPTPAVGASWDIPVSSDVRDHQQGRSQLSGITLPDRWTVELGHYLGWLVGDGSVTDTVASAIYGTAEDVEHILPRHEKVVAGLCDIDPSVSTQPNGTVQLRVFRQAIRSYLSQLGLTARTGVSKRIPHAVFEAPDEFRAAFLQGLFDADGTCVSQPNGTRYVGLSSISRELLEDVLSMLATFGIHGTVYKIREAGERRFSYTSVAGERRQYEAAAQYDLRISGPSLARYHEAIGFCLPSKRGRLEEVVTNHSFYRQDTTVSVAELVEDGEELTFNLTEPRNHSYIVDGVVVRNCGEYVRPDNSSCNLASLNLVKFLNTDGSFDVDRYEAAVRVFITAMDILLAFADYPTAAIAENTRRYRELGLGYTNLGALLMRSGLPYDSDGGRAYAAALTAVMGGAAYHQSAVMAEAIGPFEGYAPDADAMQKVIGKHRKAVSGIDKTLVPGPLMTAARKAWKDAYDAGKAHGYRNAQTTLAAPTGTISFLMDADTTGIEPDLGLVKLKKLHGGGSMKIVNASVRPALESLGYDHDQVEAISTHILETGSVLDSGLDDDHHAVFACAMGDVTISADGHMRMMAAAQPFLSGAVSKTINCPEDTTVEEIERIYLQAWQLGIKDIAIYRDNSKGGQPLSVAGSKADAKRAAAAGEPGCCTGAGACACTAGPARQRLPRKRHSETTSFEVGEASGYLTVGEYDDGRPGELFLKLGKQGSTLSGLLDAFAIAVSLGLQYGVPIDAFVAKFLNMRFEPAGMTNDPDARIAQSLVDYVARRMAFDYLPRETRESMGLLTIAERTAALEAGDGHDDVADEPAPSVDQQLRQEMTDAPLCLDCGGPMKRAGTCFACEQCGSTSGCS